MATTVIAPDGTPRTIPDEQVSAAVAAGGKPAVKILDPQGTPRWISTDQQDAALNAGGKLADATDTRSLFQKAKDNFNNNTRGAQPGDNAIEGFVHNVSAAGGDVVRSTAHMLAHPLDQAHSEVDAVRSAVAHPIDAATAALNQAHSEVDAARANPSKFVANAIGQIGTGAIIGEAVPIAAKAVGNATVNALDGTAAAAAATKAKLYPTSQSVVPRVSAARNLSKALVVDPAGVNNFVKAATDEVGTVVGYAQDNGIPINSKVDFANAAKQTADAVQQHFDSILEPNAKKVVAVPYSYQGPTIGEGSNATLESINNRINAISSELKSNFRKPLQAQTNAANTSDADLLAEKNALTNVLHKQLGAATGLPPEAIGDLRIQAGKLRTISDEAQLSANRDLTASGKQAMGTTTSAVGTKAGLIDRGLQMVQGGPEIIGNRQVKAALQKVLPQSLNLPQLPQ